MKRYLELVTTNYQHISIEGIDGAGKSSFAKYLNCKFNYKIIEKPLNLIMKDLTVYNKD